MTGGDKENTEAWIRKRGAKYPYCYDPRGTLAIPFNVDVLPFAVLIDPSGVVVWMGHSDALKPSVLRKHLKGALERPLWTWPSWAHDVRTAILLVQYGRARSLAATLALAHDRAWIAEAVEILIRARLQALETIRQSGNFLVAEEWCRELVAGLLGQPERAKVQGLLRELAADSAITKIIAAQRDVSAMKREGFQTQQEVKDLIARLEAQKKLHEGTVVSKEVEAYVVFLKRSMVLLP